MGAASPGPSSRTGNDNRLAGSTEDKRLLVSSAFDLEFWDNFNSIKLNCQVPTILPLASSLSSCC
jgi:hypothetical protein